ncbi:hypothetical protein [Sphaerimonospora mesophila]|uniref:hypothetical protein n=1 Tax=Sphaerimonospora mesophila TaxID=37483 RepID=UPI00128F2007
MSEADGLVIHYRDPGDLRTGDPPLGDEWVTRLSTTGPVREDAVARLHGLMLRAARHQVSRMPEAAGLGAARREETVPSAADEATLSVLARLSTFEGRSRFTTWAYKFGILHAGVEVRRAAWDGREIELHEVAEPRETATTWPRPCETESSRC